MFDCESCGAGVAGKPDDATCRGCRMVICQECCDVFDHLENGLHGRGDPREAVVAFQAQLDEKDREIETSQRVLKRVLDDTNRRIQGLQRAVAAFVDEYVTDEPAPTDGTEGS